MTRALILLALLLPAQLAVARAPAHPRHHAIAHAAAHDARRDERLLALTIWAEARSRGPVAMRLVGHVIVNRARSGGYGEGIAGVLWQRGQFGVWRNKDANRAAMRRIASLPPRSRDRQRWDEAKAIAHTLLHGRRIDPTNGATHYASPGAHPDWVKDSRRVATLAGYRFYRMKGEARPSATS
ncbi:MAG: cell wall hydrolase [Sphingomonadaceae bacterium]|nr:cell wall hydrolase [Sphingomonadaceae bacterium]